MSQAESQPAQGSNPTPGEKPASENRRERTRGLGRGRSQLDPRYYYGRLNRLINSFVTWHGWDIRPVRWVAYAATAFFMFLGVSTQLTLAWQWVYGLTVIAMAMYLRRFSGTVVTLTMVGFSLTASFRYMYWRLTETINVDDTWDLVFACILIAAEFYALLVLILGYVQTIWPLKRQPVPLRADTSQWPTVDIYIPTYNEPLKVVKPTVFAALAIDWPRDKMNVYILDDGRREEFAEFAAAVGAIHLTREDNSHAKAGNINAALKRTHGEFIAFFDCDHIPTRAFLQMTMGLFQDDKKLSLVQTPHHFLSPDPFERNLETFRKVPNEGELFYGVIQDGNDLWNAAFFCGSCAVIRRSALEEVGGVAVETVTEDAHTSLKMQRLGYNSAYLSIPLAAGLATESLSAHVKQRIRWARGMAQIFRVDNPFLGKGLTLGQRMCYGNAILHFFFGLPRMIFLTAPLSYLFFHVHIISAGAVAILAYSLPHMVHAIMTNSRIQSAHRHSFWAEVYEAVLSWYILRPTMRALFSSTTGSFDVTAKGGLVKDEYFDWSISRPYVFLFLLNILGLLIGLVRLFWWNAYETDTVLLNIAWTIYNATILGAAMAVAREAKQVRTAHRVPLAIPCLLLRQDGQQYRCESIDLSEGGTLIKVPEDFNYVRNELVQIAFLRGTGGTAFPAHMVFMRNNQLALQFEKLTYAQESDLVQLTLARADAWINWSTERDPDHPLRGLREIMKLGVDGMKRMAKAFQGVVKARSKSASTTAVWLLVAGLLAAPDSQAAHHHSKKVDKADAPAATVTEDSAPIPASANQRNYSWTLKQLGALQPIQLRGAEGEATLPISIRADEVVTAAHLKAVVTFSPALIPELSHLKVMLNDEVMATVPVRKDPGNPTAQTITVPLSVTLDSRAFVDFNRLTFKLIGHYTRECEDPMHSTLWATVSNSTSLDLTVNKLPQRNDLSLIPAPFFDKLDPRKLELPFVFAGVPKADALHAAGTVASWFGSLAGYRGVNFPVSFGQLPMGNAVVFLAGDLPSFLALPPVEGATIAMVDNPADAHGKLLLVMGRTGAELQLAAEALALGQAAFNGSSVTIASIKDAPKRKPYDAPNWVPSDRPVKIGELVRPDALMVSGYTPDVIRVPLQLAPDLYFGTAKGVPFDLGYRYTPHPTTGKSTLNINVNDRFIEALPLNARLEERYWWRDIYLRLTGKQDPKKPTANLADDSHFVTQLTGDMSIGRDKFILPQYLLADHNQMLFHYYFEFDKQGFCKNGLIDNLRGAVDADSTVDVSGFPHYTTLPRLSKFVNTGFPYTRMADLSETAFVMPESVDVNDVKTYLLVLAKMGAETGYPALRMELATAANVSNFADRDLIVIGSVANQPLLTAWAGELPLSLAANSRSLQMPSVFRRFLSRWDGRDLDEELRRAGTMTMRNQTPIGAMMQIQSPLKSGRTAVVIASENSALLPGIVEPLFDSKTIALYQGDLAVVDGTRVESFLIGSSYSVGSLPLLERLRSTFSRYPMWMMLLVFIGSILTGVALFRVLRQRSQARLKK